MDLHINNKTVRLFNIMLIVVIFIFVLLLSSCGKNKLIGRKKVKLELGDEYVEEGLNLEDGYTYVPYSNLINNMEGEYEIEYKIYDENGKYISSLYRKIIVKDKTAPIYEEIKRDRLYVGRAYNVSSFIKNIKDANDYEISPNKRNSNNLLLNKNSYYYYQNSNIAKNKNNEFSKNFSSGLSQGKTLDSFVSDVSVNCNYANFNNACISKINYTLKKNKSVNDFETLNGNNRFLKSKYNDLIDFKMNHMFGGNEKYKSLYNRCFSARHNNNSRINIFDTNQLSKEIYVEQRKDYILKNTRALFTRNKNFVQYKRKKKMVDKNV